MSDESRQTASTGTGAAATPEGAGEREKAPNTLLNGLIGGIAAILLGFVPFSTVLGGGIAGYLEGGTYDDGGKVGAIAGSVAFVPFVAFVAVMFVFVPVAGGMGMDAGPQMMLWPVLLFIVVVSAVYTVGLSVVGGVIGVYLKEEL